MQDARRTPGAAQNSDVAGPDLPACWCGGSTSKGQHKQRQQRPVCRTCQHVGAEGRAPGYSRRQVQCNLPAQVQGGCPCAMDAALLGGAPSELPWQVSAKVAGSGAKSCATSSCTSQVKRTQDLLQAALRTYIPAFMSRKRGQTSRRSLLQAARRTRCTADGPAPGFASGRLLPIPPQSSEQLVCLGRARDAALLCRMANLPACRLQTPISLKCCSNAVARVTTCCSTQALQIAAPLWAQQIPPVSQFRFAEPKVQKQVQKQAAAAAVGVVCRALPLVAVFGAATSSHDAALLGFSSPCRSCLQQQPQQQQQQQPSFLWSACRPESKVRVPPLAAGSLMAVHGGRLPQAAPTTAARSCTTIARSCTPPASRTLRGWLPAGSSKKVCSGSPFSRSLVQISRPLVSQTRILLLEPAAPQEVGVLDSGGSIACMARAVLACMAAWVKNALDNNNNNDNSIPGVELVLPGSSLQSLTKPRRPEQPHLSWRLCALPLRASTCQGAAASAKEKKDNNKNLSNSNLDNSHSKATAAAASLLLPRRTSRSGSSCWQPQVLLRRNFQLSSHCPLLGAWQGVLEWELSASDFVACSNNNNSNLAADRAVLAVLTSWLARGSFGRAELKKADAQAWWFAGAKKLVSAQAGGSKKILSGQLFSVPAGQLRPARQALPACDSLEATTTTATASLEPLARPDVCLSTLSIFKMSCNEQLMKGALVGTLQKTAYCVRCAQKAQGHEWSSLQSVHSSVARQPPIQSQVTAFGAAWFNFSLQLANSKPYLLLQPSANWQARPFRLLLQSACQSSQSSRAARNMSTAVASRALRKSRQPRLTELKQPLVHTSEEQVDKSWPAFGGVCRSRNTQKCGTTLFLHCKTDCGVDAALLDGDVAKPPAAASRQYSPKRPCSSSLTPSAADPSSEAGFQVARLCRSATAVVLPHRGCTMLHTLHVPHTSKAKSTRAYTEAFPRSDVCLSTLSALKISCIELLRKSALAGMPRKTTDRVRCAQEAKRHEWYVLQSVRSSVARQPLFQSRINAFGSSNLAKCLADLSFQLASSKPCLLLQLSATGYARPLRLSWPSACQSPLASRAVQNTSTAGATAGALWKSGQRCSLGLEQTSVPQPAALGQKLAARAGFRPRRVALLHRDAAKQLAGSLTAGHRRRGVVAALSYARLASVHARYPRQHRQERVLTRQLLKFSRQPEALSTFAGLALRKFMSDTAHAGVERKTTDCVRCAQQAQGHEWCVLQSIHFSVARQPPVQSQVTAFGAAWSNFSLQLACQANWRARPFRLHLQSVCQSSQSSWAVRKMSTAVASRALRKSSQPRLTELKQPLVHTSEEQVDKSWPAFGGVCRSRNTQKCGTTLFLHCMTDCGVDAALLDGDVAKPPAAASRQYSPKRPCSSSLTPSAADPSSEAGFQVARLCRSATAVVLPHRGCTMLHTLHVPHTSKAAHAVSPCNAVEIPTHLSVRKHTTMAWSASHFLSEVAALLQSSPSMKLAELKVPHSTKCQSLQPSASPLSRVSASRPCLLQGSFVKLKGCRPFGMQVRHESPCGINAATSRFASLWAESRTQKSLWTANSQCLSWQTTAPRCEDFFCLPPAVAKSTTTTSVTMGPIARGQAVCHTSAPDLLRDAFGTNDSLFAVSARRLCGSRRACCRSHHPCQIPLTFPMALSFPNNCACEHAVTDEREFSFRMTPNECNSNNNSNTSNANTTTTSINTNSNNKIIMPGLDRLVSSLFMLGKQLAATFRASIIIRVATSPFRPRCCLRLLP
ncbi:unnamed protein product [Polarella glacialis]|uniref:Uncharacterized protein n=1 Tax=Polarella glacialis TaxID=89957 RepID=A0A813H209_POLGL|nr:unnamed protein product [Polarella glacialis]